MSRREQLEAMLANDPNDTFLRYALAMELENATEFETSIGIVPWTDAGFTTLRSRVFHVGEVVGQDRQGGGIANRVTRRYRAGSGAK